MVCDYVDEVLLGMWRPWKKYQQCSMGYMAVAGVHFKVKLQ